MRINGIVQTVAPIHITAPKDATITKGNATETAVYPVYDWEAGRFTGVPGISSTHLRGSLRHIASDIYNDEYRKRSMKIPAALYNAQRHGSTGGSPSTANRRASDYDAQLKDPIMAVFGGGPKMLEGNAQASWALPIARETVDQNLVALPDYADPAKLPAAWQLIATGTMFSKLDMMRGQDVADILKDYEAEIAKILEAIDARRKKKSSDDGAADSEESKARDSNILTYRYLIPGILLQFKLSCADKLSDAAKGLFLESVRRFFEIGKVGGLQRIGIGHETFNLDSVSGSLLLDGSPIFVSDGSSLTFDTSNSLVAEYAEAFERWRDDDASWDLDMLMAAAGLSDAKDG